MRLERELREEREWRNPLASQRCKPYLEDLVFPADCDAPTYKSSVEILKRFYSTDRESYESDIENLNAYLDTPDAQIFIIEGDVGVGKSWFVRYELLTRERPGDTTAPGFGVVDMLRGSRGNAADSFYRQICPILASHFRRTVGSARKALLVYAIRKYASRYGTGDDAPPAEQIKAGGEGLLKEWLALDDGKELGDLMLSALEESEGPLLFLTLDNLDRASEEDQQTLLEKAQRTVKNVNIRLVVPLRRSSRLLRDRFENLQQVTPNEMTLSPLRMAEMLKGRFECTRAGEALALDPPVVEKGRTWTYEAVVERIFDGDAGRLLESIACGNCRVALKLMKRLLWSSNIHRVSNIGSSSAAIPAWMAGRRYEPDDGAPILNLFDNERMSHPGNALVRYRVLEYLVRENAIDPPAKYVREYFQRLGYSEVCVRDVLSRFLMADMVTSDDGLTPDDLRSMRPEEVGTMRVNDTGKAYFFELLDCEWYYISAKRAMVRSLPERVLSRVEGTQKYYVRPGDFVDYLREEERAETTRIRVWEGKNGQGLKNTHLTPPHVKAKGKLFKKETKNG